MDFLVFGLGVFGFDPDVVAEDVRLSVRGGKVDDVAWGQGWKRLHGVRHF
jgi:hypothetical protein